LTPSQWAEIRALWETGETTLNELSERYGVTTRTLQAHFAKQKAVKGSKAKEIAAAVTEAVSPTASRIVKQELQRAGKRDRRHLKMRAPSRR
jgi:hypothetical protein